MLRDPTALHAENTRITQLCFVILQHSMLKIKNLNLKIQTSLIFRSGFLFICDRDRIRTYDRLLRRQMLYPAELRDQLNVSGCKYKMVLIITQDK